MMDNDNVRSCHVRPWAWTIRAAYIVVNIGLPFVHNRSSVPCAANGRSGIAASRDALRVITQIHRRHSNLQQQQQLHRADDNLVHLVAETSCPYGAPVAGWLAGGLNYMYQIDHHLFPGSAAFTTRQSHRSCARQRSNTV
jgi:hypothetical protein